MMLKLAGVAAMFLSSLALGNSAGNRVQLADASDLNPQPLPPIVEEVMMQTADAGDLNPQPLPPIVEEVLGALFA
jgi:hypothetical protein